MGSRTFMRVAAAAGLLSAVGLLSSAPPASAVVTVVTFTWTGTDAGSATSPNPAWSDGANWSGGAAPAGGVPVNLDFPASACTTATACSGVDDITGLIVDTISMATSSGAAGGPPPPGYNMVASTGDGITLDGGFTLTGASSATASFSTDQIGIPITLGAANSWNLAGPSYLQLTGDLSGSAEALQVAMSRSANLELSGASNEVGAVDLQGADTTADGVGSDTNGSVFVDTDLNGTDHDQVNASNIALTSPGATEGPVAVAGGWFTALSATQAPAGATGVTAVDGGLSLDTSSLVQYQSLAAPSGSPTAGTDYPQITATGTAALGGAQLGVSADCGMADNTTFTILQAGSVTGNFDVDNGSGLDGSITNDRVIQSAPDQSCTASPGPYLRISYTATTVTATVVPQPTSSTTVSADPASPEVNQPYQLVATVTPNPAGSAVPSGAVSFSVNGAAVAACQRQPVQAVTSGSSTTYQASCEMPPAGAKTTDSLSASYSGDQILTSSNGTGSVTVAAGSTSTSLGASTTNPYVDQSVTYTATVAPAPPSGSTPSTPGGDVEFLDGTTPITGCTSQPLSATTPLQATCQQTYASTGSHAISAQYLGDGNFATSTSGTVPVNVQAPATSSTGVSFVPTPTSAAPVTGQPVTVTATVTASSAPTGTVSFYADGAPSPVSAACTDLGVSGSSPYTASCSVSFATAGAHSVAAVFTSSTAAVSGSNGSSPITVQKAGTSTVVGVSPASPVVGQAVTYTAAVAVSSPGSGNPGGSVSFRDGGTPITGCTSVNLGGSSPDTATCAVTYDSTASHSVTATYGGSSDFTGSPSSPVSVTVGLPPGTTSSQAATSATPGGSASATNQQVTASATGGQGTVTVSQYPSDPKGAPSFKASGNYFDVSLTSGSTFASVSISDCNLAGGTTLYWWDPTSGTGGAWLPVSGSPGPTYSSGPPACITATLGPSTSPSLSQMGGTVFASGQPNPVSGYWLPAGDGGIFSFDAPFKGSAGGIRLAAPIVGMAVDPCTGGYWLAAADGGIFNFGAPFYGSLGGLHLSEPIVGISSYVGYGTGGRPLRCGYRLVSSDGGVFSFDAPFYGSLGGVRLAKPIVGVAGDPVTGGYWLVASDGGVFGFDAPFYGSLGGVRLAKPIVGVAADPVTGGYWLVASDGGVFGFDAPFEGSAGGIPLDGPVVGISAAAGS